MCSEGKMSSICQMVPVPVTWQLTGSGCTVRTGGARYQLKPRRGTAQPWRVTALVTPSAGPEQVTRTQASALEGAATAKGAGAGGRGGVGLGGRRGLRFPKRFLAGMLPRHRWLRALPRGQGPAPWRFRPLLRARGAAAARGEGARCSAQPAPTPPWPRGRRLPRGCRRCRPRPRVPGGRLPRGSLGCCLPCWVQSTWPPRLPVSGRWRWGACAGWGPCPAEPVRSPRLGPLLGARAAFLRARLAGAEAPRRCGEELWLTRPELRFTRPGPAASLLAPSAGFVLRAELPAGGRAEPRAAVRGRGPEPAGARVPGLGAPPAPPACGAGALGMRAGQGLGRAGRGAGFPPVLSYVFLEQKERRLRGCPRLPDAAGDNGDTRLLGAGRRARLGLCPPCVASPLARAGPGCRPRVREGRCHLERAPLVVLGPGGKRSAAPASPQGCPPAAPCPLVGTQPAQAGPGVPPAALPRVSGR